MTAANPCPSRVTRRSAPGARAGRRAAAGRPAPRHPPELWPDEVRIRVERLNLDAASFRQLERKHAGDGDAVRAEVLDIVATRGKMQNPETGSGGMLVGTVEEVGPESPPLGLRVGDRVATLVSLTLTPLVDRGRPRPLGRPQRAGARRRLRHPVRPLDRRADPRRPRPGAGARGDGRLRRARADRRVVRGYVDRAERPTHRPSWRSSAGPASRGRCRWPPPPRPAPPAPSAWCRTGPRPTCSRPAGLADAVALADARDPVASPARSARPGGPADVTVVCVDVPGCEGGAILSTADRGTVIFFSMATSFSAAALGAEGLAADVTMLVGNGYVPGHADYAMSLLRAPRRGARPVRGDGPATRRGRGDLRDWRDSHPAPRWLCPHGRRPARHRPVPRGRPGRLDRRRRRLRPLRRRRRPVVDLDGRLVTPAFVDAHAHLAQTGLDAAAASTSPRARLADALDALDALARHAAATAVPAGARPRLGRDPLARGAAVHPAPRWTGPSGAAGVPVPGRRALRGGLHRPARRVPRADRADGFDGDGLGRPATRTPRPRGGVPADAGRPCAGGHRPRARRRGAAGDRHGARDGRAGDSPAEDFARIAEVCGRRRRCPRWSATGASSTGSSGPSTSAAPARRGPLRRRRDRLPHRGHARRLRRRRHHRAPVPHRRPGPRPRGGLHPGRHPGRLPRDRRPRAVAEVVEGLPPGRRDRRRPGGRPGPAPPRAPRDGRRPRRSRCSASSASPPACSRCSTGPGAGTTRCTPSGSAPTGRAG